MRKKPIEKPMLEVDRADILPGEDGYAAIPASSWFENTMRLFREQHEADGNPLWAWRALFEVQAYASQGHAAALPEWVSQYLERCAVGLLSIDADDVPDNKMPHAISRAIGMTRKGGKSYPRSFHARFDELVKAMRETPAIPPDAAADMRVHLSRARGMRADKRPLESMIDQGRKAFKAKTEPKRRTRVSAEDRKRLAAEWEDEDGGEG